ncbi:hypothetical protein [Paenibacillus methanolicus]|uniref:Uncharacterized protein n=1 Tax=Paenibacillus methanolicus TaxID=582686 RepID=A0A5S5C7U9_9BACL|nr:hypothetical protein [Paenibacillus methanolicus]TYP74562.1 hypothetical protein BCM02_105106 [Paenibacillus methanolicus]
MHPNPKLRLNGKWLWPALTLLIATSWVGNLWYYEAMQLEKPVFLKHYMILYPNLNDGFELTYAENKSKGKKVTGIRIEELPELLFRIDPHPDTYTHQVLGKAYGEWRTEAAAQVERAPITVKEATVYYNDGPPEKVPIGEIRVVWDRQQSVLVMSSTSGSTNGNGQYSVNVTQPITLEQVDYSFSDRLGKMFELTMEGGGEPGPQLPLRMTAGDLLTFDYQWTVPDESPAAYEIYRTRILMTYKTEDGRTIHDRLPVNFNLYLSEKQMKRLVRAGGELP